jgi:hypothetical protein
MAKNKSKKSSNKVPKGKKKVRGFDERQVSTKHMLGSLAKGVAGMGLDALSKRYPGLGPARQMFKQVAGFDERQVASGGVSSVGASGGMTVQTMDAPVSFARNSFQTGWKTHGVSKDGGELWSFTDLAFSDNAASSVNVTTSPTINTFARQIWGLSPISGAIFPNFKQAAAIWERWRPVKLVLHYCHFAPTSVQAAVMLAYYSDTLEDADYASSAEVMALENSVQGNAYEDFGLTVVPPEWRKGEWFYTDYFETASELSGLRQAFAGDVMIATDMCPTVSTAIGRWYVELLFEVCDKRPPIAEVSALLQLRSTLALLPPEHRKSFLLTFISPRVLEPMLKPLQNKPAVPLLALRIGQSDDLQAYCEHAGVCLETTSKKPESSREIVQMTFGIQKPSATGIKSSAVPLTRG